MMKAGSRFGLAVAFALGVAGSPVVAQELSEKSVLTLMDYAWGLTPQQFSKPDGTVVQIDKKKREEVMIPLDVAREVIKVGRMSAHAQICDLREDQADNHNSLMRREFAKKTWTPQQIVYINQLHLTTVMFLTGRMRLVEKQGDKEVVIDEGKAPPQSCTPEQRQKVKDVITAYVKSGPPASTPVAGATPPAAPAAETATTEVPKAAAAKSD